MKFPKKSLISASMLSACILPADLYAADDAPYFGQVAISETEVNYGTEGNGFGNNATLNVPVSARENKKASLLLSAGITENYRRIYGQYHVRPDDDISVWSLTGNFDFTTSRNLLLSVFAGAGIGMAGASWDDNNGEDANSQSLSVVGRVGVLINPTARWGAEIGYRYEKTNLDISPDDDPATDTIDESEGPSFTLKDNHGFYAAFNFPF